MDLKRRTVSPASRPLPHLVQAVADKMSATQHQALRQFEPNEANAICYDKAAGCELLPHVDDRQMSTDLIVNLSLLCDCVMTYVEDAGRDGRSGWEGAATGEEGGRVSAQAKSSGAERTDEVQLRALHSERKPSRSATGFDHVQAEPHPDDAHARARGVENITRVAS